MDGFQIEDNIIVIASTNLPESLDPAVKRSGRFDRIIDLPFPNLHSRQKLFKYYLDKVKYNPQKVDISNISGITNKFTGADIKNLVNFAGYNCLREKRNMII